MSMFGNLKNAAIKKVLKSKMKDVPQEQQDMIMGLMEKDPELMQIIAKEMKAEMDKNGGNEMAAMQSVLPKHQQRLMAAMSPEMIQNLAQMQAGNAGKFDQNGRPF